MRVCGHIGMMAELHPRIDGGVFIFRMFYRRHFILILLVWAHTGYLTACTAFKGKSLTIYQVPAAVLDAFKELHQLARDPEFIETYKKGIRVYLVQFTEGEELHEMTLNAYGKPVVSKVKSEEANRVEEAKGETSKADPELPDANPSAGRPLAADPKDPANQPASTGNPPASP